MPKRSSPLAALVAVLALLLAVPVERGRPCDICPVDCPLHGAKRATSHIGCHHAAATREASIPDGSCAVRAGCGHHGSVTLVAFHAEPPAPSADQILLVGRFVIVVPAMRGTDDPAPRPHPHESLLV